MSLLDRIEKAREDGAHNVTTSCTCGGKSIERGDGTIWATHYGGCPALTLRSAPVQSPFTRRAIDGTLPAKVLR